MSDFDFSELKRLEVVFDNATERTERMTKLAVKKTGFDVVAGAQALVPVDTGNLKNTIGMEPDADGLGFEVIASANYAADVEYGTLPHVIKARPGGVLFWPGAAHPVKSVNHPGTKPQPYMGPAFEAAVEPFIKAIESIGGRVLE